MGKALVGPHGRFNVGCFAMLLDKLIGGAVDVEIGGHFFENWHLDRYVPPKATWF